MRATFGGSYSEVIVPKKAKKGTVVRRPYTKADVKELTSIGRRAQCGVITAVYRTLIRSRQPDWVGWHCNTSI
jgi:hypothetical protein